MRSVWFSVQIRFFWQNLQYVSIIEVLNAQISRLSEFRSKRLNLFIRFPVMKLPVTILFLMHQVTRDTKKTTNK